MRNVATLRVLIVAALAAEDRNAVAPAMRKLRALYTSKWDSNLGVDPARDLGGTVTLVEAGKWEEARTLFEKIEPAR